MRVLKRWWVKPEADEDTKRDMPSPYEVLGVSRNADADEIKKAYRKMALVNHPDKGGDEEKFKKIQKAYEILGDERRRMMYDQTGSEDEQVSGGGMPFGGGGMPFGGGGMPFGGGGMPFGGGGMPFGGGGIPFDIGSLFGMFGPNGPGNGPQRPQQRGAKAPPKVHEMAISLHDYYQGKCVTIQFECQKFCDACKGEGAEKYESCKGCGGSGTKQQVIMMGPMQAVSRGPCGECNGSGKRVVAVCKKCNGKKFISKEKTLDVIINPGMRPKETIIFPRECSDQHEYNEAGDVHIVLQEADEEFRFKRFNGTDDLSVSTTIGIRDSLLGYSERMEGHPGHPQGLVIEIPVGVQHGEIVIISGEGMPKKGGGRGDLRITVYVRGTEAEKEILRANKEKIQEIFSIKPPSSD